jgi:hypothetical protein
LLRECRINFANYEEQKTWRATCEECVTQVFGHALFRQSDIARFAVSIPAMLQPHFWNLLGNNRILAGAAIVRAKWGAIAFGSFQSPG